MACSCGRADLVGASSLGTSLSNMYEVIRQPLPCHVFRNHVARDQCETPRLAVVSGIEKAWRSPYEFTLRQRMQAQNLRAACQRIRKIGYQQYVG